MTWRRTRTLPRKHLFCQTNSRRMVRWRRSRIRKRAPGPRRESSAHGGTRLGTVCSRILPCFPSSRTSRTGSGCGRTCSTGSGWRVSSRSRWGSGWRCSSGGSRGRRAWRLRPYATTSRMCPRTGGRACGWRGCPSRTGRPESASRRSTGCSWPAFCRATT